MTVIERKNRHPRTPLALPGLVLPGLGHLVPAIAVAGRKVAARFSPKGASTIRVGRTVDERTERFVEHHGVPGDAAIGVALVGTVAMLLWSAVAGFPRIATVLYPEEGLGISTYSVIAVVWWLASLVGVWWAAVRRAFPRVLSDEEYNSNRALFLRNLRKNRTGMVGMVGVLLLAHITALTPLIAPFDPDDTTIAAKYLAPGWHVTSSGIEALFILGTDSIGRDMFSRLLFGCHISLAIGMLSVFIAASLGTSVGAVAGYYGGVVDRALMWVVDLLLSQNRLLLLLAILGILSANQLAGVGKIFVIVCVLSFTGWMGVARIVRSEVLSLRQRDFIQAAVALGLSPLRIVFRHLVPNAFSQVIVNASLAIGGTILLEASLSFLGLGVAPPTSTWGSLVNDGRGALLNAPWLATFPGLAIVWAVMAFNLLGDGLRDALDPKLRGK